MSILELCRVTYRYPGDTRAALDDLTLSVDAGELVVIAGASGSGKSTLLRAASGLGHVIPSLRRRIWRAGLSREIGLVGAEGDAAEEQGLAGQPVVQTR